VLRETFAQWGLPKRLRVDNGTPWGSSGDLPPDLALWILGLGVGMHWNHPRCPQENGVIERSQGTAKNWADPSACISVQQLQEALDRMDHIQRELYPVERQLSRRQLWPGLEHSGRRYTRAWERQHWNLPCALEHLSGYAVTRHVSPDGRIMLYNRAYYVGIIHKGKTVYVMLDPQELRWLITDTNGCQLRCPEAKELNATTIQNLQVARSTADSQRKRRHATKVQ